jgi:hypothetical protein
MAGENGSSDKDLLLKLLEGLDRIEKKQAGLQGTIDKLDSKLNNTNGTLTLIGRVLNELTVNSLARIDNHEERLRRLEAVVRP